MRRFNLIIATLAIFGMFIAACGSATKSSGLGTQQPGVATATAEVGLPNTGGQTPVATQGEPTQPPTQTTMPSPQPTQAITPTQALPTVPATPVLTPTQAITNTGTANTQFDPGHLSNLMRLPVVGQNNQPLGSVTDMVLDLMNLKIEYVIVNLAQSANASNQTVAIPWRIMQIQTASSQNNFLFTGDMQKLANAPQFDPSILPPLGQPAGTWDASLRDYWGSAPAGSASGSAVETPASPVGTPAVVQPNGQPGLQGVILATQVLAYQVNGPDNQLNARVNDVVLDSASGDLQYVLIVVSGLPGLTNPVVIPVPLEALGWNAQSSTININFPPQVLLSAPKFNLGELPQTTNPDWDAQIKAFWQQYLQPQVPQK